MCNLKKMLSFQECHKSIIEQYPRRLHITLVHFMIISETAKSQPKSQTTKKALQ